MRPLRYQRRRIGGEMDAKKKDKEVVLNLLRDHVFLSICGSPRGGAHASCIDPASVQRDLDG